MFGIFHFNLAQGIAAFFAGIVYMLVVLWTESILSGIVVHASYNAIWVASTYLGDFLFLEKYNYGISITKLSNFGYILMSISFFAFLYLIYRKRKFDALSRENPYFKHIKVEG